MDKSKERFFRMKSKVIIFLIVISMAVIGVIYDMVSTPHMDSVPVTIKEDVVHDKNIAPDFPFTTIDGENLNLSDLKGKVILLNFWASWCAPCVQEFPAMIKLVESFDGDVVLLAVSKDDELSAVQRFVKRFPQYPHEVKIVWDQDKYISEDLFHTMRLPETIIIDQNLSMRRKIMGEPELWEEQEIYEYIKTLFR